uniref:Uncharacterized protein n=1 Tax=Panagrellus redivivus TaxID=6233 RepID=A0A7E4UPG1_PANRE
MNLEAAMHADVENSRMAGGLWTPDWARSVDRFKDKGSCCTKRIASTADDDESEGTVARRRLRRRNGEHEDDAEKLSLLLLAFVFFVT